MPIYEVTKRMEIAGSHNLCLPYESKCKNKHGHNWVVTVTCSTENLTEYGMVVDFTDIKKIIHDVLDHQDLNELFDFNPTAENIAKWVHQTINDYIELDTAYDSTCKCTIVSVQESEGNTAKYIDRGAF